MPNHLSNQSSSYLKSHAADPVDWYPWGTEAFEKAEELDRPVLISIGYDSCHWCHVMQRESFKDPETADKLNDDFVSVKIDRELRPDVDHLYMTYTTLSAGQGGWPMTVFVTPSKTPFFAGTYFPKVASGGGADFGSVLTAVHEAFVTDREKVESVGREALSAVSKVVHPQPLRQVDDLLMHEATEAFFEMEDKENGGLGGAPKFPQAPVARYMLAYAGRTGNEVALEMARRWAYAILRGGVYDQVGGGMFRYSTDPEWLVPHFEKMLYDNGQLLSTIALLYRLDPTEELAHCARQTAAFLERDLAAEGGGYHSSLDAEAEGVEGGPYAWRWSELEEALDAEGLQLARDVLGASEQGNWYDATILTRRGGREIDAEATDRVLARLLDARAERPQPRVVTNLLTDWNAIAARGLIEAGTAIGDDALVQQGTRVVDWLLDVAVDGDRVTHAIGDDSVADLELVDDYAALIMALHVAGQAADGGYAEHASRIFGAAMDRFEEGSFVYMTGVKTDLPIRPISYDDAPTPSGAATLAEAYATLRPADTKGLKRILVPATGIITRAPYMGGTWLRVMLDVALPQ